MEVYNAEFVSSFTKESMCPTDGKPEFAFIGRSNVGKSSLINMLTNRKGLAKVSATPGKTQLLNYFLINKKWYLVDLPGYGYARVSKTKQSALASMINGYMINREAMVLAFVLIDSNVPPSKKDIGFIDHLGEHGVPIVLIFTKADRLGKPTLDHNISLFMAELSKTWEELPRYFVSSSEKRTGREEILSFIEKIISKL